MISAKERVFFSNYGTTSRTAENNNLKGTENVKEISYRYVIILYWTG